MFKKIKVKILVINSIYHTIKNTMMCFISPDKGKNQAIFYVLFVYVSYLDTEISPFF